MHEEIEITIVPASEVKFPAQYVCPLCHLAHTIDKVPDRYVEMNEAAKVLRMYFEMCPPDLRVEASFRMLAEVVEELKKLGWFA